MDARVMKFPVSIISTNREIIQGYVSFTKEGPMLLDNDELEICETQKKIEFKFIENNTKQWNGISPTNFIDFDSKSFIKKISLQPFRQQELYPPSTNNWIQFLSLSGPEALFSVQSIKDEEKCLLSVVDISTGNLVRLHPINNYEVSILSMETDWDYYNRIIAISDSDSEELSLSDLLKAPAPSWTELGKLLSGVNIPNLQRYDTVGETLNQLVPESFPKRVREELIVFLAWTIRAKIPTQDPLDFLSGFLKRFRSARLLRALVFGHVQCLIQNIEPPQYVRLMAMADQGSLKVGIGPKSEETEQDPWSTTWYSILEMFPDRKSRIFSLAQSLNTSQEIYITIPVTKEEASISKDAWLDRFALVRASILMRGYVQDRRLGLVKVVYIGGAHRWPHRHLQWTARLGNPGQKPPYIQVMVFPASSIDRIMRIKQNFAIINWTASRFNFGLYNQKNETWKDSISYLIKSLSGRKSIRQLDKEFDIKTDGKIKEMPEEDTKVLDFISWGIYPQTIELGNYDSILNIKQDSLKEKLTLLRDNGIIQIQYFTTIDGLASICLEVRGELPQLCSFARAALLHLPSATVMLSKDDRLCVVMARVPEEKAYDIIVTLPAQAREMNLVMKGHTASAYAGYIHTLYQRLLRPDRTWNDDISGLLSQIRS